MNIIIGILLTVGGRIGIVGALGFTASFFYTITIEVVQPPTVFFWLIKLGVTMMTAGFFFGFCGRLHRRHGYVA